MTDLRGRLRADLMEVEALIEGLVREREAIMAASLGSNADDEHDPEGATIAFEREQVSALLAGARGRRQEIERALVQWDDGGYGRCESCGGPIGQGRLEALPAIRLCIECARRAARGSRRG